MPWSNGDLATAATAVIAFAGLLRPEIERLFRRLRTAIDIHPAGKIEVGFSTFGPTIGMQGTLRTISSDEFISSAKVIVERVADHLRHEFEWAVFRPQAFSATTALQPSFEIAAGFYLDVAAPRRFNIQFHDSATADKFRQSLAEVRRLWMEYLEKKSIVLANTNQSEIRNEYNAFHHAYLPKLTPLHQVIEREFYWHDGKYRMTLELRTSRPEKTFAFNYSFTLSQAESDLLRLNAIGCMQASCDVPNVTFQFVYTPYAKG